MREHGVLTEMQSLGWLQCGVPWGCGGAAEDEAGEARFRAVEHLLYPHHLPAHPFISVTGTEASTGVGGEEVIFTDITTNLFIFWLNTSSWRKAHSIIVTAKPAVPTGCQASL